MMIEDLLKVVCYAPHVECHTGVIEVGIGTYIHGGAKIDLTGSLKIGNYCMIGEGTRILTPDHYHDGRRPLLEVQKEKGVRWEDKVIGDDVWLHGCTVLYQVTNIPTGTVVGSGAVLTKNPEGEYGIYAGNPARRIGERQEEQNEKDVDHRAIDLDASISHGSASL